MPLGVDDVLEFLSVAAASAAGKAAGDLLIESVFKFATKDDLAAAIAKIEAYIGQQMNDFRNDNMTVNTYNAMQFLQDYANNPDNLDYLEQALQPLQEAAGWLQAEIAHQGDDVLRLRFVETVQYVSTDLTLWYNRTINDPADRQNLVDSINRLIDYLSRAVTRIRTAEIVSCGDIHVPMPDRQVDPGTPRPIVFYHGTFRVSGELLPGGGYDYITGPSQVQADAQKAAERQRDQIMAAYNQAELQRKAEIYDPVGNLIVALRAMPLP